jgi:glycosyltransferase involved in cell wall biosynthesis
MEARTVVSSYTTYEAESRAKVSGLLAAHGPSARLRYRLEHAWIRLVVERYERRGYTGSALVLFNYESVRRLLLAKYPLAPRCLKVPYTAESAFVHEDPGPAPETPPPIAALAPSDAPLVVAVSRHEPNKGIPVLLSALARLRARGVPFRACLVGGGPLLEAHRRLAARLGLGTGVIIAGLVPDPHPYLRHADVYVLPSLHEQSGSLALIEALQVGLPVVASRCDGIPEDLADQETALLVSPGDDVELAAGLERLCGDPELRRALGRRARAAFELRFSPEALAAALSRVYGLLGVTP